MSEWRRFLALPAVALFLFLVWSCSEDLTSPQPDPVATPELVDLTTQFSAAATAAASDRGLDVEICGNGEDDDFDGATDEIKGDGGCISGPGTPTSGDGVVPEEWTDNPNCEDAGYGFGFKVAGAGSDYNGTFSFTSTDGELTGGAPEDSYNSVTLSIDDDGKILDWSSTLGLEAVIMKGGDAANIYNYDPEDTQDTGLGTPGTAAGLSHVEFCYDYELEATKTADAEYTRTYTWDIEKLVSPMVHKGFIGDPPFTSWYEVTVDQNVNDSDFKVTGYITITNPTPFTVPFSVSDFADGSEATVTCPKYTLGADDEVICSYEAALGGPSDGTNTATIASENSDVLGATATADYAFGDPTTIGGYPTVNVTDTNGESWTASGDETFEYTRKPVCSNDEGLYTNGVYEAKITNTATIVETEQSDDAEVYLTCYKPEVSKDADTEWYREYTWTITKSAEPVSHTGAPGEEFSSGYTVGVTQTIDEYGYRAFGTILVHNPADQGITVDVSDAVNGNVATVDCGSGATSLTVAAGATESCNYSVDLDDNSHRINTATIKLSNGYELDSDPVDVDFGDPIIVGEPTINVTDTNGGSWSASGDATWTYELTFTCPDDAASYAEVPYVEENPNTATIVETEQSDDASVKLTCTPYPLTAEKDATATYDERHTWDVEKSVDPTSQSGYPGDYLDWTWTVDVSESFVEEKFAVSGEITISNQNPFDVDFSVSDALDDGTVATITDCTGTVTVDGESSVTCSYEAAPGGRTATENTATVTSETPGIDGTEAKADVDFVKNVINGTATIDDDQESDFPLTLNASEGPWQWTETQDHTCSSDAADYGADGSYSATLNNTAIVTGSDGQSDNASASTTYTCEAGFVDIFKTTNGEVDPDKDIRFDLYSGTTVLETQSTLDDGDGTLEFQTALVPGASYSICESPVPAGYTFEISVNGGNVLTYAGPPGDPDPTGEIQCFDFTAELKRTLTFNVNNSYPGGAPRTPGYWKNWSLCDGSGNQVETAAKLGGVEENVFLLDNLLPQTIDGFLIDNCQDGVYILSAQSVDDGPNRANDAAYTLARALLAARLNQDAGACPADGVTFDLSDYGLGDALTFEQVLSAADDVLSAVVFDGTASYLSPKDTKGKNNPKKALADQALALYEIIDDYNNSEICTGEPSH